MLQQHLPHYFLPCIFALSGIFFHCTQVFFCLFYKTKLKHQPFPPGNFTSLSLSVHRLDKASFPYTHLYNSIYHSVHNSLVTYLLLHLTVSFSRPRAMSYFSYSFSYSLYQEESLKHTKNVKISRWLNNRFQII